MKKVFKYSLGTTDYFSIHMPEGAEILSIQTQHGMPRIWALVEDEPGYETEVRYFRLAETGHAIEDNIIGFVGTFQMYDGDLIFHVFEIDNNKD